MLFVEIIGRRCFDLRENKIMRATRPQDAFL